MARRNSSGKQNSRGKTRVVRNVGDIPAHKMTDQSTSSVAIPRTTSMFTTHQTREPYVLAQQALVITSQAMKFELGDLPNVASFAATFDQYRIDAIRVTIRPQNTAIGLFTNTAITLSDLLVVIDYNDATALTSLAQAREYDNCMTLAPTESGSRTFRPCIAVGAYNGAFTGYTSLNSDAWIDMGSTNVQHYGLKAICGGGAAGQTTLQVWEIIPEFWISFRHVD